MENQLRTIFAQSLDIEEAIVEDSLKYAEIPQWDSMVPQEKTSDGLNPSYLLSKRGE